MKNLKNLSIFVILLGGLFLFAGCTGGNLDGSLSDMIDEINASTFKGVADDNKPRLETINVLEDRPDNIEYYIGTTEIEYEEVVASEPMMGSIPYSVVLVRMKDGADIEVAKEKIRESVNPRKWFCVEVPEEDVIVKNRGNVIILIMVADEQFRTKLEKGFDNL